VIEIIWRHDPDAGDTGGQPTTAQEARARLDSGSEAFAALGTSGGTYIVSLPADALGLPSAPGGGIPQEPFAAVLGCSDARVPAELVFGQAANDLFVVRVAGNVPGTECLGSLDYAVAHLASLRLLAVVGHTGCGAVTAAVDAFLTPEAYFNVAGNHDLRAIVDAIMAAVATSSGALGDVHGPDVRSLPGFRSALIETSVVVNAALTGSALQSGAGLALPDGVGVAFGVYDLARRSVGLPSAAGWRPGLDDPPASAEALREFAREVAAASDPRSAPAPATH
jgi:carbonic anhydrase